MTVQDLLQSLRQAGVEVWSDAGQVRYRGTRGALGREVVEAIRHHRKELLLLLAESQGTPPARVVNPVPDPPSALDLRISLGWSTDRFAAFCKGIIGRPGPSTVEEDRKISVAMDANSKTARTDDKNYRNTPDADSVISVTARGGLRIDRGISLAELRAIHAPGEKPRTCFYDVVLRHGAAGFREAFLAVTGCDVNERNPEWSEIEAFDGWLRRKRP